MKRIACLFLSMVLVLCAAVIPLAANAAALGDVSGDGYLRTDDARLALRAAIGLENYKKGSEKFTAADIIADGVLGTDDARLILRIAVGLEPTVNQYDILRSGAFYMQGKMEGGTAPMKMAVSKDAVYIEMAEEGMQMGYLAKGDQVYFVDPANKSYHKLTSGDKLLMKSIMGDAELPDAKEIRSMVEEFGFSKMPALSQADRVAGGKMNGVSCAVYTFTLSDGSVTNIYMYGYRMLAMEARDKGGRQTNLIVFDSISADVPVMPPKDYSNERVFLVFMAKMMGEA